jgi:hypothetical protein
MRRLVAAAVLAIAMIPSAAIGQDRDQSRREALEARRDSLEAEVVHRFVRHLARDLHMTDDQRDRTERVLRESGLRRRALSLESSQLRGRLYRATRDSTTADAEFVRLLAEYQTLRTREHDLWRQDQAELARILDPRQRTQFLLAWARFQDDMREIIWRRLREGDDDRDRRDGNRRDEGRRDGGGSDDHNHSAASPPDPG